MADTLLTPDEVAPLVQLTRMIEEKNKVIADQAEEIEALRKELLEERARIAEAIRRLKPDPGEPPTARLPLANGKEARNDLADSFVL